MGLRALFFVLFVSLNVVAGGTACRDYFIEPSQVPKPNIFSMTNRILSKYEGFVIKVVEQTKQADQVLQMLFMKLSSAKTNNEHNSLVSNVVEFNNTILDAYLELNENKNLFDSASKRTTFIELQARIKLLFLKQGIAENVVDQISNSRLNYLANLPKPTPSRPIGFITQNENNAQQPNIPSIDKRIGFLQQKIESNPYGKNESEPRIAEITEKKQPIGFMPQSDSQSAEQPTTALASIGFMQSAEPVDVSYRNYLSVNLNYGRFILVNDKKPIGF